MATPSVGLAASVSAMFNAKMVYDKAKDNFKLGMMVLAFAFLCQVGRSKPGDQVAFEVYVKATKPTAGETHMLDTVDAVLPKCLKINNILDLKFTSRTTGTVRRRALACPCCTNIFPCQRGSCFTYGLALTSASRCSIFGTSSAARPWERAA